MPLPQWLVDLLARYHAADPARQFQIKLALGGGAASLLFLAYRAFFSCAPPPLNDYNVSPTVSNVPLEAGAYDVAIIGCGPSGSTAAWYLAKAGRKVLVLDKAYFPRDKICGDAVTIMAQDHLKRMGVLQKLTEKNQVHWSQSGGFVSPGGYSFIGNSAKEIARPTEGVVVAIKRIDMDNEMAQAARAAGATLKEGHLVEGADLDASGYWDVKCLITPPSGAEDQTQTRQTFRARLLLVADGAPSAFAKNKGIVKTEPDGVCSRSYITGSHSFDHDGVVYYPPSLLPGYCALLRHSNNELGYCAYIIPGGPAINADLPKLHQAIREKDPYVKEALRSKDGTPLKEEPMKSASLRFGGIPKSWGRQMMIIGDAAGFIDPLTGEGIQYATESGFWAAKNAIEAFAANDLTETRMKKYHDRWYREWGSEFYWSMKMSLLMYRFPIMLDAAASVIKRKGTDYLRDWSLVMTGQRSKLWFVQPTVFMPLLLEMARIGLSRLTGSSRK